MLEVFVGLLIGSLLGEYVIFLDKPVMVWILTCAGLLIIMTHVSLFSSLPKRVIYLGIFSLSMIWGAFHNWRDHPSGDEYWTEVVRGSSSVGRYVVVRTKQGVTYARGNARRGDFGRLTCQSGSELFRWQSMCRFHVGLASHYVRSSTWIDLANKLEHGMKGRVQSFGQPYRGWLQAVLMGDWSNLDGDVARQFRGAGLIHLLVLSGFHFSLVFFVFELLLRMVFGPLYLGRLISAQIWISTPFMSYAGTVVLGLIFLLATGVSQPALRAFLVYSCARGLRGFVGAKRPELWIVMAATLQLWVAPIGFWQRSNLFSWLAYLWLVLRPWQGKSSGLSPSRGKKLLAIWNCQLGLAALSLILIGEQPTLGIFANIFLAPVFSVVFVLSGIWLMLPESHWFANLAIWGIDFFFSAIDFFASNSKMLVLSTGLSQLLTLLLIAALVCYSSSWCHERRHHLERKRIWHYGK